MILSILWWLFMPWGHNPGEDPERSPGSDGEPGRGSGTLGARCVAWRLVEQRGRVRPAMFLAAVLPFCGFPSSWADDHSLGTSWHLPVSGWSPVSTFGLPWPTLPILNHNSVSTIIASGLSASFRQLPGECPVCVPRKEDLYVPPFLH